MTNIEPVLYETHSHTPFCKHAVGDPSEYAQVALDRGLKGYTISCHNPMPDGYSASVRMDQKEFSDYLRLVAATQEEWGERLDVRLGLECDYFPGYEDWLRQQVNSAEFDYILGSVHPQCREFRDRYWTGDPVEFQRTYFELLATSAELGIFDSLSHPDLIKNITSRAWEPTRIMDDIRRSLDRIADTGVAMELNTSGLRKTISEMNPFPDMLREMRVRSIPITVGADAHQPERCGDGFEEALDLLAECGYQEIHVYLGRQPHSVNIESARASLVPLTL